MFPAIEVEGPADTDAERPGRLPAAARAARMAGPTVVIAALGLVLAGVANVHAAGSRAGLERELGRARAFSAAVPRDLAAGDPAATARDLDGLRRSARRAHADVGGPTWWLADRLGTGDRAPALRRDAARLDRLAAAAVRLRGVLDPLDPPENGTGAGKPAPVVLNQGEARLAALDDLARGLNGYASAATRARDPSAAALGRAALAAGLLPDLAGAEAPRTWTACRTATGPCGSVTMTGGVPAATGYRADVQVTGAGRADLFGAGDRPDWNSRAMFALLYHLGPRSAVTVHSPVMTEQQALQRLSRPDDG